VPTEPDITFPLALDDFRLVQPYVGGSEPRPRYLGFLANGQLYTAAVWIGRDASTGDQDAMSSVVSSLRFLPLMEGTEIGKDTVFFVLGRVERYPVGSVLRIDMKDLPVSVNGNPFPFYLVHTDRGIYALAWRSDFVGGYKDCDLRFDAKARQFFCRQKGARWDLQGGLVRNPDPARHPVDRLPVLLVRISLDGHVLVSSDVFMSEIRTDLDVT
jgi:hypothetical protein